MLITNNYEMLGTTYQEIVCRMIHSPRFGEILVEISQQTKDGQLLNDNLIERKILMPLAGFEPTFPGN